jgi:hypothetical protein
MGPLALPLLATAVAFAPVSHPSAFVFRGHKGLLW